jgi:transcriptional regulator with XRE-family HTH domain
MFNNLALEQLINKSGLSLKKLAKELDIAHSTLSLLIRGLSLNPHPETVNSIASYFGISPEDLFIDDSHKSEFIQEKSVQFSSLSEVLKYLMLRSGIINSSHLYQHTGIAIQTIDRILSKETTSPNSNTLTKLAEFFNVNIAQLKGLEAIPKDTIFVTSKSYTTIPVIKYENVMSWIDTRNPKHILKKIKSELITLNSDSFAIEVIKTKKLKISYLVNTALIPEIGDTLLIKDLSGKNIQLVEKISNNVYLTIQSNENIKIQDNQVIGVIVEETRYRL